MSFLGVGTLVVAKHDTGVCRKGEVGLCYHVSAVDGSPCFGILFEYGDYDGFTLEEVERFLSVSETVFEPLANYQFDSTLQLVDDYRRGKFASVFPTRSSYPTRPRQNHLV